MLRGLKRYVNEPKKRDMEQLFGLELLLAGVFRKIYMLILILVVAKYTLLTELKKSMRRQASDVTQLGKIHVKTFPLLKF